MNLRDDLGELGPADLPADAPAHLVVGEIVELLGLGTEIAADESTDYRLLVGDTRRRIHQGESLNAAGVRPGDTLILSSLRAEKWLEGTSNPGVARKRGLVLPVREPTRESPDRHIGANRMEAIALRRPTPSDQSRSKGRQLPLNRKTVPVEIPNSRAHPAGSSTA